MTNQDTKNIKTTKDDIKHSNSELKKATDGTSTNIALYRKYRPMGFSEVLGQEHIIEVLAGSLTSGKLSHAYLFSGPRGTGKTSTARILAEQMGCTSHDLYEIDGASNRKIEHVRELRETVHTMPFESKIKVYIIDEVHMLTKEAFNALLKTLEEPPSHVVFMLATTEIAKLPDTIVSRCQTLHFRRPSKKVLRDMALSTAKKEGYVLERDSAELIALLGDGSFRDTHGILQKVFSVSSDKKISSDIVARVAGAPSSSVVNDIIMGLASCNTTIALTAIQKAVDGAVDMKILLKMVLERVRYILLLRYDKDLTESIHEALSEEDFEATGKLANQQAPKITSNTLVRLIEAYEMIARSPITHLPLEMAIVELVGEFNQLQKK